MHGHALDLSGLGGAGMSYTSLPPRLVSGHKAPLPARLQASEAVWQEEQQQQPQFVPHYVNSQLQTGGMEGLEGQAMGRGGGLQGQDVGTNKGGGPEGQGMGAGMGRGPESQGMGGQMGGGGPEGQGTGTGLGSTPNNTARNHEYQHMAATAALVVEQMHHVEAVSVAEMVGLDQAGSSFNSNNTGEEEANCGEAGGTAGVA